MSNLNEASELLDRLLVGNVVGRLHQAFARAWCDPPRRLDVVNGSDPGEIDQEGYVRPDPTGDAATRGAAARAADRDLRRLENQIIKAVEGIALYHDRWLIRPNHEGYQAAVEDTLNPNICMAHWRGTKEVLELTPYELSRQLRSRDKLCRSCHERYRFVMNDDRFGQTKSHRAVTIVAKVLKIERDIFPRRVTMEHFEAAAGLQKGALAS